MVETRQRSTLPSTGLTSALGDEHPRLDWHLENWYLYSIRAELTQFKCNTSRYWTVSDDFDSKVDRMENSCAKAVDVIVYGLPHDERMVVMHRYLGTRQQLNKPQMEKVLINARALISAALLRRGIP